jgi:L-lactate utilization protein LutB
VKRLASEIAKYIKYGCFGHGVNKVIEAQKNLEIQVIIYAISAIGRKVSWYENVMPGKSRKEGEPNSPNKST